MWESIMKFIRKITKKEDQALNSKDAAKERLHLVLMQDRANVSADFLELMKQEIIEVIKKYIDVDETAIDVRLTNKDNGDGTKGAPALYANIPIINIKDEVRQNAKTNTEETSHNTEEKNLEAKEKPEKVEENPNTQEENQKNDSLPENDEDVQKAEELSHEEQKEETKVTTQNEEE